MIINKYRRGDTIIEVILAFGVFALLAVGTTVVMNRGLAMGQQSLERTLVRQQVDSQAELLRYARDTGASAWEAITTNLTANPELTSYESCPDTAPTGSFAMNITGSGPTAQVERTSLTTGGSYLPASYYSRVQLGDTAGGPTAEGLWIQAVSVNEGPSNAYDMYIRACWDSMGSARPLQVSTIVRLYEN